jgi:hypothetical protein
MSYRQKRSERGFTALAMLLLLNVIPLGPNTISDEAQY